MLGVCFSVCHGKLFLYICSPVYSYPLFWFQYLQCFVVVILLADLTLCSSLYLFEKLAQAQGLALKESDHPSAFVWDSPGLWLLSLVPLSPSKVSLLLWIIMGNTLYSRPTLNSLSVHLGAGRILFFSLQRQLVHFLHSWQCPTDLICYSSASQRWRPQPREPALAS